jgi:hypothetical protein
MILANDLDDEYRDAADHVMTSAAASTPSIRPTNDYKRANPIAKRTSKRRAE